MTLRTNARLAGIAYLLYIATGITEMVVSRQMTAGAVGIPARLASIAEHAPLMGVIVIFSLLQAVYAIVLGVTLWALTRDGDRDIAMLGMACRVVEGANNALAVHHQLELRSLAHLASAGGPDAPALNALGSLMLGGGGGAGGAGAFLFGLGSFCFCWVFVRSRTIPAWLAWPGLVASAMWVIGMPLQLGGFIGGALTMALWIPMGLFEVTVALWLIFKGVSAPGAAAGARP
jgi:hypothetical protein